MVSDEVVVFDNLSSKLYVVIHVNPEVPDAWIPPEATGRAGAEALQAVPERPRCQAHVRRATSSRASRRRLRAAVRRSRGIIDGDIMQVVLSQRLSVKLQAAPWISIARCAPSTVAVHVLSQPG
jgi:anthranilate synthase component 1